MIKTSKIPMGDLLFGKHIYSHYEMDKGLMELEQKGRDDKILDLDTAERKTRFATAVHADMLANTKAGLAPMTDSMAKVYNNMLTYRELCRQHCMALVDTGYGMKRSAFKKLDTIDLTSMADYSNKGRLTMPRFPIMKSKEYIRYVLENSQKPDALMCIVIPPFTDFTYKLHADRYLHVKVEEVSIEDLSMKLFTQDYTINDSIWVPGTKCHCEINMEEGNCEAMPMVNMNHIAYLHMNLYGECCNPHDINLYLDFNKLGWSKDQVRIWLDKDETYSKRVMDIIEEKGTSSCLELIKYVIMCNAVTNYMLYGNKPKIVRESKDKPTNSETKTLANNAKPNKKDMSVPERRIRYIGTVKIVSASVPKQATPERVRHYKVAVWKARGGIRRMKDGRVIPFKESIRYRQKLKGKVDEQEIAQTVLKLRDNSLDTCDNKDKEV